MMNSTQRGGRWIALVAGIAIVGLTASCSTGSEAEGDAGTDEGASQTAEYYSAPVIENIQQVDEIRDMLPQDILDKGSLEVGTDAGNAPQQFFADGDSGEIIGVNPDLTKALGKVFGVDVNLTRLAFDGSIPALQAGRFDIVSSGMYDRVERHESVTIIDDSKAASGLIVRSGEEGELSELADFCGKTIALQKGTAPQQLIEDFQPECGDNPIKAEILPGITDCILQLKSQRADAVMGNIHAMGFQAAQSDGAYVMSDKLYDPVLKGPAVDKNNQQLADAILAAYEYLFDSGEYTEILDYWGIADLASITKPAINAAADEALTAELLGL